MAQEMTKDEINKILAEKMFGLKPQVDFGTWEEHEWKKDENGEIDDFAFEMDNHNGPSCERCGYSYCEHCLIDEVDPCEIDVPDYTTKHGWWGVLDKLQENYKIDLKIYDSGVHFTISNDERAVQTIGETIPMAVCKAAVSLYTDFN